jgi:hypothetical protein
MRDMGKFMGCLGLGATRPAFRGLPLAICSSLLFGLLCAGPAKGAEEPGGGAHFGGPGAQIAIADFDGDRFPDSASIQAGTSDGTRTSYSIRLRLTTAGHQAIEVFGPIGGLEIAARDVNGDHAIDLVLTAAWLKQPVAILLNDGHGNFSPIDPAAYPEAFHDPNTVSDGSSSSAPLAAVNPSDWRAKVWAPAPGPLHAPPETRHFRTPDSDAWLESFLILRHCRAPPVPASAL